MHKSIVRLDTLTVSAALALSLLSSPVISTAQTRGHSESSHSGGGRSNSGGQSSSHSSGGSSGSSHSSGGYSGSSRSSGSYSGSSRSSGGYSGGGSSAPSSRTYGGSSRGGYAPSSSSQGSYSGRFGSRTEESRSGQTGTGTDRAPRRDVFGSYSGSQSSSGNSNIFNRAGAGGGSDTRYGTLGRAGGSTIGAGGVGPGPVRGGPQSIFARSEEGRRYNSGVVLRGGGFIGSVGWRGYFPGGYSYYPYYGSGFDIGLNCFSPYWAYYDDCAPFILRRNCFFGPPPFAFIDIPIYYGSDFRGYRDDSDGYYLDHQRDDYRNSDPDLDQAISDVRDTFRAGDIEALVKHTDPQVKIAIFLRGKYQYSMNANDYLDLTRDALRTTDTIQFDLYRVTRRADSVYVVSGKHIYRNKQGNPSTVYVSFVLERLHGAWTVTQVGTAPDHIREPH